MENMTYISLEFAAFTAVLLLVYYLTGTRYQWIVLTVASLVFYLLAGPKYIIYVLVTALSTFLAAGRTYRLRNDFAAKLPELKASADADAVKAAVRRNDSRIRLVMTLSVVLDLGILIVLKYTDFIIDNINTFLPEGGELNTFSFVLPLGLSFYTFSAVGYVVDVARGKYEPERNFIKFFLYLTYFPQIIQGPIPRFEKLSPQLTGGHKFDFANIREGFELVLWGIFKKMVIADSVSAIVSAMLTHVSDISGAETWLGMFAWGIQLYADFSGGVDVSRGVSQMLGIELEINFARPYFAEDLSDYWNRWHISLGNWLKDYFFYPVAFSKSFAKITKSTKKRFGKFVSKTVPVGILSLILFTIIGIWHGADWGEVLFGVFNGAVILFSTLMEPVFNRMKKMVHADGSGLYRVFCSLRTFFIITLARVISLPAGLGDAWTMYGRMFGGGELSFFSVTDTLLAGQNVINYVPALAGCLLLFAVSMIEEKTGRSVRSVINERPMALRIVLAAVGTAAIVLFGAYGIGYEASNFIYSNY